MATNCIRRLASLTSQLWQQQQHQASRLTGFTLYVKSNFSRVRAENPVEKPTAIMARVAAMYKQLEQTEKQRLKQEAAAAVIASAVPSSADSPGAPDGGPAPLDARQEQRRMQAFAKRHGMPPRASNSWRSVLLSERLSGVKGQKPALGSFGRDVDDAERQRLREKAARLNTERSEQLKLWAESHGISARLRPGVMVRKFYAKYAD